MYFEPQQIINKGASRYKQELEGWRSSLCCAHTPLSRASRGCVQQSGAARHTEQQAAALLPAPRSPASQPPGTGGTSLQASGPDPHPQDSSDNKDAYVRCLQRSLLVIW